MHNEDIYESVMDQIEQDDDFTQQDLIECSAILEQYSQPDLSSSSKLRLDRLHTHRFKILEDHHEFRFNKENTIIHGSNSQGKTSILEAIRFNLLGLQQKNRIRLTEPVTENFSKLSTDGYWSIDDTRYLVRRTLKDEGGYTRHDWIRLVENPPSDGDPDAAISFGGEVNHQEWAKKFGMSEFEGSDFGHYNIFSLFFLMSADYKLFLDWQDSTNLLDLLFGINLSNVTREVDHRINTEYEIEEQEENSPARLEQVENRRGKLKKEIAELKQDRELKENRYDNLKDELDAVRRVLSGENKINELRDEKSRVLRKINRLEQRVLQNKDELRKTEQHISRYEEIELSHEIGSVASDLNRLMALPEKCPVCTTQVSDEDKQRLVEDDECPLCYNPMPDGRSDSMKETEDDDPLLSVNERENTLEELAEKKESIKAQIKQDNKQITYLEDKISELEENIADSDISEYVDERDELEEKVDSLESEVTELYYKIESKQERLNDVEEEIDKLGKYVEEYRTKAHKQDILKRFKSKIVQAVQEQRDSIKLDLESIMDDLLQEYFTNGLFANSTHVEFPNRSNYQFTIYRSSGDSKPSTRQNSETTEGVLQALLFHTAVLKKLADDATGLPIRVFLIDAPFSNEPDEENSKDIENLLINIPQELEDFQTIITVADTNFIDLSAMSKRYNLMTPN